MIGKVLKETLADKRYDGEEAKQLSKDISDTLQGNLKGTREWTNWLLQTPI